MIKNRVVRIISLIVYVRMLVCGTDGLWQENIYLIYFSFAYSSWKF